MIHRTMQTLRSAPAVNLELFALRSLGEEVMNPKLFALRSFSEEVNQPITNQPTLNSPAGQSSFFLPAVFAVRQLALYVLHQLVF